MKEPLSVEKKINVTLAVQGQKAIEELLSELYESGYKGYVDLWFVMEPTKNGLVLEINSTKVNTAYSPKTHEQSIRYHIVPGKGYKQLPG